MKKKIILALGADIKNKFLLVEGSNLSFGPDIVDLSVAENYELFKKEVHKVTKKIKPDIVAYDLHPNYFSSIFAKTCHLSPITYHLIPVQHHHAHIASVMQEHGLKRPLIGVSFDGTGYGTDGNIWGGEFLLVNKKGFKRLAHLEYYMMPGGDKVVREPWRMVLSILGKRGLPFVKSVKEKDKKMILSMMSKNINSPLTSSAGRLFDAAASIIGICEYASYEAQGPIKLEAMCMDGVEDGYEFEILKRDDQYIIDTKPVFFDMVKDLREGKDSRVIATKFHNSIVGLIVSTARKLSKIAAITDIALSGGVFQNKFLSRKTIKRLLSSKFNVFINDKTPVNDYNISLGQYFVALGSQETRSPGRHVTKSPAV